MNTIEALNLLITVTTTLTNLADSAAKISMLIAKAQSEGRTDFTVAEWDSIIGADDAARALLMQSIAAALRK
jgi:hypothetical protein